MNPLEKIVYIPDESAMLHFGQNFAQVCKNQGVWIYLCGELGAGKTTLVRGFLQGLGYQGRVKSPTYSLIESYEIGCQKVYHFDFYRLSQQAELTYLGLEEYFIPAAICLVEWPDHFLDSLPTPDMIAFFSPHYQGRQLQLQSRTARGVIVMEQFLHE